jgi:hypothetical protein
MARPLQPILVVNGNSLQCFWAGGKIPSPSLKGEWIFVGTIKMPLDESTEAFRFRKDVLQALEKHHPDGTDFQLHP